MRARPLPIAKEPPLAERLWARTAAAAEALTLGLDDDRGRALRCLACAHRCRLGAGEVGLCGVRQNDSGTLRAPWGYVARRYVRPVEINTIYHVRPGARALTFGMYGCDLRCPYCQNWEVSQALREPEPSGAGAGERPIDTTPEALVDEAVAAGCEVLCSAYNEPMITAEWAHAIFTEARRRGLLTAVISDGNTTPEALRFLRPVTDVFRVDLKGSSQDEYRALGGRLQPVLEAIAEAKRLGYWVEVVTLIVPGFNDDLRALRGLARTLAAIDPGMPWHLNAFLPRYKLQDRPSPPEALLVTAAGVGLANGLRFVYVGNTPESGSGELAHTRCPTCHALLVERHAYETRRNELALSPAGGACRRCGTDLPGLWARPARRDIDCEGGSQREEDQA